MLVPTPLPRWIDSQSRRMHASRRNLGPAKPRREVPTVERTARPNTAEALLPETVRIIREHGGRS